MILIQGKTKFAPEVAHAMGLAPTKFHSGVLGSLLAERDMFVGSGKRDGVFTKKLMRKTGIKGQQWPRNVARVFGGRVDEPNKNSVEGLRLVMGVGESKRSRYRHANPSYGVGLYSGIPFRDVLDFLNIGGSFGPAQHEFMIMPIYRNFTDKKAIGKQWRAMLENKSLEFVREGNRVYYFKKDGTGDDRDLLFIGIKRATVQRQYNFVGDWSRRIPGAINRIQKRVDRVTQRINQNG